MKMLKTLTAVIFAAALPCVALAQTNPNLTKDQVLTPGQWNQLFVGKQDTLGFVPLNSAGGIMTGRLITAPPSSTTAGFNLSCGTAPASPVNGDQWCTSAGLFVQINGVTIGPLSSGAAGSFTATQPLAVTFPGGVVNYALNFNSSLVKDGSNNLGINLGNANTWTGIQTFPNGSITNAELATAYLPLAGGTMSGNINMGGNALTGAAAGFTTLSASTSFTDSALATQGVVCNSATGLFSTSTAGCPNTVQAVSLGGTGGSTASGTLLDNITAFSSTGFLTRTGSGTYAFQSATNGITRANIAQVAASSLSGNPTGSLANESAITLDPTLGFSGTTLKATTATTSQAGVVKPDGSTITVVGGVITASGASATAIAPGTTTVSGGGAIAGYDLYNNGGTLGQHLVSGAGGFINKFRNGTMDVFQRGASGLAAAATLAKPCVATADGWCVVQTGAQFNCSQGLQNNNGAAHYLGCSGGTGNTDTTFTQRIESSVASPLAGATVTVQFFYNQNSGSTITPKISTCFASAADNFTTCTADLAATSLTACGSAVWCQEAYTFTVSASASQGYQVTFDCNTALTSAQSCLITAADIRVTPGVATGINANPPPLELRPVGVELALCQRYFYAVSGMSEGIGLNASNLFDGVRTFPTQMRAVPTLQNATFAVFSGSAGTVATNQNAEATTTAQAFVVFNSAGNWSVNTQVSLTAQFNAEL